MRAIIIDPFKKEIREVDFVGDFRMIQQFVAQGGPGPLQVTFCSGPRLAPDVMTWCDDEGYFRPDQAWFRLSGYPNPLAGYMLVIGSSGPDEAPLRPDITAESLQRWVHWIDEKLAHQMAPPITVTTLGADMQPDKVVSETHIDFSDKRPIGRDA